jgi:EmrB/QacA subfamily drug resistance transporter
MHIHLLGDVAGIRYRPSHAGKVVSDLTTGGLVLPMAKTSPGQMATAWKTLALAAVAVFIVSLDTTVLFVAFPSIRRTFNGVSGEALSWILNVYTIGYGALLVPTGRLADRFGRRAFFLGGIALFTAASCLCGFAPDLGFLVAARGLQSVGAAMLMPASFALVLHAFPAERRGVAIGIWGAVGALAAAVGPGVGSAIVQFASWRWVFFLNFPVGLCALAMGWRRLAESRAAERGALPDAIGTVLLISSFGALAYAIIGSKAQPALAGLCLAVGGAGLVTFVWRSLRVPVPALDLRLFRLRTFATANALSLVFSIAFTVMFLSNVFFLTERWQRSIFEAGLWISPGPLAVIPVAILAGRRADRIGYRPLFVVGGLLYALGALWLLHLGHHSPSFFLWLPGSIVMGAAIGMVLPSLGGASALELDASSFAVGSGVNQAIRQFGSALGVAIVVVVLGKIGPSAPFERVFWVLVTGGLLTAGGGAAMPARLPAAGHFSSREQPDVRNSERSQHEVKP